MLFKIGNSDLTNYVQETTYKIDSVPIYAEWEDGNHVSHKDFKRNKIQGDFDMVFVKETDFDSFKTLLNSNTQSGVTTASFLISNSGEFKNIECYIKLSTAKRVKISSSYSFLRFKVDVEER